MLHLSMLRGVNQEKLCRNHCTNFQHRGDQNPSTAEHGKTHQKETVLISQPSSSWQPMAECSQGLNLMGTRNFRQKVAFPSFLPKKHTGKSAAVLWGRDRFLLTSGNASGPGGCAVRQQGWTSRLLWWQVAQPMYLPLSWWPSSVYGHCRKRKVHLYHCIRHTLWGPLRHPETAFLCLLSLCTWWHHCAQAQMISSIVRPSNLLRTALQVLSRTMALGSSKHMTVLTPSPWNMEDTNSCSSISLRR